MSLHDKRFPNESDNYRGARDELLKAEADLRAHIKRVAEQRRKLPLSGKVKEDYVFERIGSAGPAETVESVKLSDLFRSGKDTLAVYSSHVRPPNGIAVPYPALAPENNLRGTSPLKTITSYPKPTRHPPKPL